MYNTNLTQRRTNRVCTCQASNPFNAIRVLSNQSKRNTIENALRGDRNRKLDAGRLGVGTWAWGNRLLWNYDESMDAGLQEVFDCCMNAGINLFDTGDSYGTGRLDGKSEQLLGQFRKDRQSRRLIGQESAIFATKLASYPWRLTRRSMVEACRQSSIRLQVDQIELAQLHWSVQNYAPWQERALWDGLGDMAEEGLAKAIGVSNYGPRQLQKIHQHLSGRGIQIGTCQVQFSLLSYDKSQKELLHMCNDLGIRLIAYSPLALGLLTGKYGMNDAERLPRGLRSFAFRDILPGIEPLLTVLREVSDDVDASCAQVAIAWCMAKGTIPIPGAKDIKQAQQNVDALKVSLSEQHCDALESSMRFDIFPLALLTSFLTPAK